MQVCAVAASHRVWRKALQSGVGVRAAHTGLAKRAGFHPHTSACARVKTKGAARLRCRSRRNQAHPLTLRAVTYAHSKVKATASDRAVIVRFEEFAGGHRFVFFI